ncbi:LysR family transcriptional regulator [Acidovorax sp. NCPPB 2350]|nr:LysR family transcriptional regulator [Acidovorax sp. NCPPB 2350]
MRITLRQLEILLAVADSGSTVSAGQRIGLSQSATSGALKELEALLGTALFDRVGKRLALNEKGRALLPQARAVVDAVQGLERQFGVGAPGGARGAAPQHIRLGASTTIGNHLVPALIAAFLQERPATEFEVRIGNTREIAAAVARLEVDFGLIEGPCHERGVDVQRWREDELVIVCAPGHALAQAARAGPVGAAALRAARWLLREPGSGTREAAEQALLPHLDHFPQAMVLESSEALKQAAAAGLGLACLSRLAVADLLRLGRLVALDCALPRLARPLYLVHHRGKPLPGELRALLFAGPGAGEGLSTLADGVPKGKP